MSTLALPQARIPFGYATVGGQRVPVEIDIEWMRALTVLVQRAGGTSGLSTTDVDMGGFAAMQPMSPEACYGDINQASQVGGDLIGEVQQIDLSQPTQFWSP